MVLAFSPKHLELLPGSEAILRGQTWADYEALLEHRGDNAAVKICFNAHTQEISIMVPLAGHGRRIDSLVDLVKALLRHQGRDWDSSHPMTLKRLKEAGVEPDACFYIQNWQAIVGKERIDLSIDPPPDLAIEMDLTSLTNLEVYRTLVVPEVWIYRQGILKIHVLTPEGYQDRLTSPMFEGIDIKKLLPQYVERSWREGSSVALREFEAFLKSL